MPSQPVTPVPATGLPPGVQTGPLGLRVVAQLIDAVVPVVIAVLTSVIGGSMTSSGSAAAVSVVGSLLVAAWFVLVWWMFATKAAGPGMRAMKLQLVGLRDGRPIGWSRFFLRALVLAALSVTGIGLILLLVFLVQHPRRQGWHDRVADSVVIRERALAPRRPAQAARPQAAQPEAAQPEAARPQPAPTARRQSAPTARDTGTTGEPTEDLGRLAPSQSPAQELLESPLGIADSVRMTPRPPVAEPQRPDLVDGADRADDRPLDVGWLAVLDDGREADVTGLVLLGRNPQARPGEDDAELIKVADETRTVSKTHLSLSVDANGLCVMDRGSTNGTVLTDLVGASKACPAGDVVSVTEGSIVSFGDHWLKIERRP